MGRGSGVFFRWDRLEEHGLGDFVYVLMGFSHLRAMIIDCISNSFMLYFTLHLSLPAHNRLAASVSSSVQTCSVAAVCILLSACTHL